METLITTKKKNINNSLNKNYFDSKNNKIIIDKNKQPTHNNSINNNHSILFDDMGLFDNSQISSDLTINTTSNKSKNHTSSNMSLSSSRNLNLKQIDTNNNHGSNRQNNGSNNSSNDENNDNRNNHSSSANSKEKSLVSLKYIEWNLQIQHFAWIHHRFVFACVT